MHLVKAEILHFLLLLTLLPPNTGYQASDLTPSQLHILVDFHTLGLCFYDGTNYYPTRYIACLIHQDSYELNKTILVETNFKVYAYTTNDLQKSILRLFMNTRTEFPNMVAGELCRDSVKRALDCGISAEQIICYLSDHLDPKMVELPINVIDQLHLWQNERHRLETTKGYLYSDFPTMRFYDTCLKYAISTNGLLWHNASVKLIFINEEKHDDLKAFIKKHQ